MYSLILLLPPLLAMASQDVVDGDACRMTTCPTCAKQFARGWTLYNHVVVSGCGGTHKGDEDEGTGSPSLPLLALPPPPPPHPPPPPDVLTLPLQDNYYMIVVRRVPSTMRNLSS
jgi:hypothetical protein